MRNEGPSATIGKDLWPILREATTTVSVVRIASTFSGRWDVQLSPNHVADDARADDSDIGRYQWAARRRRGGGGDNGGGVDT